MAKEHFNKGNDCDTCVQLHKHNFEIIAFYAMRSAIGHEREKRRRRIDTISLDAPVAGTNGAILADIITYENMGYSYLGGGTRLRAIMF